MTELTELILLILAAPMGLGFLVGKIGPQGVVQGCAMSTACALIPAIVLFAMTQESDSITRAASWFVIPVIFAFMCLPAMVGVAVARRGSAMK